MGLLADASSPRPIPARLFCLLGAFLLAVACWQGYQRLQFLRAADSAPGQVVGVKAAGTHPRILFHAGATRINYPQGGMVFGYAAGQRVQVRYLPERPAATAVVDDFGALWGPTAVFAALGGCLGFLGLAVLRAQRAAARA